MGIINKIVKGVKAARMANVTNELNENRIKKLIDIHKGSDTVALMEAGVKYYQVDNDILSSRSKVGNDKYRADNKLAHGKYKDMVDEKVSYLLSKPYSLNCEDKAYLDTVAEVLGEKFQYTLYRSGFESSNKGISWLHPYIDQDQKLKFSLIPAEQVIPIWHDLNHRELDAVIRYYNEEVWQGDTRKSVTSVEVWEADKVTYYLRDKNTIYMDPRIYLNEDANIINHYQLDGVDTAWGKVPFVPFKNNFYELPDIKFVKSLIDAYDKSRSDSANYVEDVSNWILTIYGYSPDRKDEFKHTLKNDHMMFFDTKEEDGVDVLTPSTDIASLKEHWEQLKRDIVENGQSVNKDLDKFGSAPSGISLHFLYSSLELKTSAMAIEYNNGFNDLRYFIDSYLALKKKHISDKPISIQFNADMTIDETAVITNCSNSKGVVSDETILTNHPWVKNVGEELDRLKKQNEEMNPFKDKIPTVEDDD